MTPDASAGGTQGGRFTLLRDAIVCPFAHEGPVSMRMGVFGAQGSVLADSLLQRHYAMVGRPTEGPPVPEADAPVVTGPALYAGPLFNHYGHFLLESLARLWLSRVFPDRKLVWSVAAGRYRAKLRPWQLALIRLLGAREDCHLVWRPQRFADLALGSVGYRIQDRFERHHAAFLGRVPRRLPAAGTGEKLWLSRSGIEGGGGTAVALEKRLADLGWTVFQPEAHLLDVQLERLATADRIAGEEGSALHSLALLSGTEGLRVDIFARDPEKPPHKQNGNFETIARVKELDQRFHICAADRVLTRSGSQVEKAPLPTDAYLDLLSAA
ncbi:MAG: hypothetical protein AAFR84_04165 [Pseudomonadota bacterium]